MNAAAALLRNAWRLAAAPATRRFARALHDPEPVQRALLARLLRAHAGTRFGREHGYARLTTAEAFRDAVPARDHAGLLPWIDAAAGGDADVLTPGRPTAFLPTSGTTSGSKLIPWTPALRREFNATLGPWITGFMRARQAAWRGAAYWSLPPAWPATHTPAAFPSDSPPTPPTCPPSCARSWPGPSPCPRRWRGLRDPAAWRHTTLLHLLGAAGSPSCSIWSPVFLTALLEQQAEFAWPCCAIWSAERVRRPMARVRGIAGLRGCGCGQIRGARRNARGSDARASPPPEAIWPRLAAIRLLGGRLRANPPAGSPASSRRPRSFPRACSRPRARSAFPGPTPRRRCSRSPRISSNSSNPAAASVSRGSWRPARPIRC
ncbi:MAG: GH3 auxin-responsive promoter family protein [Kiritimatiellia bacterium]